MLLKSHPVPISVTALVIVWSPVISAPGSRYSTSPSFTSSLAIASLIDAKCAPLAGSLLMRHDSATATCAVAIAMATSTTLCKNFFIRIYLFDYFVVFSHVAIDTEHSTPYRLKATPLPASLPKWHQ